MDADALCFYLVQVKISVFHGNPLVLKAVQHELAVSAEDSGNLLFFPNIQEEASVIDVTEIWVLAVRPSTIFNLR